LDTPCPRPTWSNVAGRDRAERRVDRRVQRTARDRLLLRAEERNTDQHRDDQDDRRHRGDGDREPPAALDRLLLRPELVQSDVARPCALGHGATVTGPTVPEDRLEQ
jgi:hypothetical protein